MTKRLNCLLAALTLIVLSSPAQSEWFASVPPKTGDTAIETAGAAPADSSFILAWNLDGQVDLLDYLRKIQGVIQAGGVDEDIYGDIEKELGRSPEQILGYFSGAGYLSLREGSAASRLPQLIVALSVRDSTGLSTWLAEMLEGESLAQKDGFQLYFDSDDDFVLGLDRQWMFFAMGEGSKPYALATFKGDEPLMNSQAPFRQAFAKLGYSDSGVAAYMDESLYSSLFSMTGQMFGMPSGSAPPIWEYGAGAIDFKAETGDLFLKISGDSKAALALGKRGGVKTSLVRKVPKGLSAYVAVDAAWYANVLEAVSDHYAPMEMVYQYARRTLNDFGDLGDAFSGPVVVGSDVFDRMHPGSRPPTVVAIAELDNVSEAHRIALKATQSEMIDTPADPQIYEGPNNSSLQLDSSAKELRFVWGPNKDEFLQGKPGRSRSPHSLVKETLDWSKDELTILAFFDLTEIAGYWSQSDDPIAKEFVRQFLDRSGMQGLLAVKSGPDGLHYRLRGMATSPLIPASGFGFWTFLKTESVNESVEVTVPASE